MALFKQGPRPEDFYTMISNDLCRNPNIALRTKGVYLFMRSHSDGWHMTVARIADALGVSKDTVAKSIKELETAGYIVREQAKDEDGRFGEIAYLILAAPHPENQDTAGQGDGSPCPKKPDTVLPFTVNKDTKEEQFLKKNNLEEEQPPKAPQGAGRPADQEHAQPSRPEPDPLDVVDAELVDNTPASGGQLAVLDAPAPANPAPELPKRKRKRPERLPYTPEFETFWKIYPGIRERKQRAYEEWLYAVHDKTSPVSPETIIDAASKAAMFHTRKGTEPGYIRRAVRWLTECGWEDELNMDMSRVKMPRSQLNQAFNAHMAQHAQQVDAPPQQFRHVEQPVSVMADFVIPEIPR